MKNAILVDTSCVYALVDASAREHAAVAQIVRASARHNAHSHTRPPRFFNRASPALRVLRTAALTVLLLYDDA